MEKLLYQIATAESKRDNGLLLTTISALLKDLRWGGWRRANRPFTGFLNTPLTFDCPSLQQEHRAAPTAGTLQGRFAFVRSLRRARQQLGARGGTQEAPWEMASTGILREALSDLSASLLPVHGEGSGSTVQLQ